MGRARRNPSPDYRTGYAAGHASGSRARPRVVPPVYSAKQLALLDLAKRMPEAEFIQALGDFVVAHQKRLLDEAVKHVPNVDALGLGQSLRDAVRPSLTILGYRAAT